MAEQQQRLPSTLRISQQPVMAFGLNGTELIIVVVTGFAVMLVFSALGYLLMMKFHFAMLFGFISALLVAYGLKIMITVFKRQKPEGYYQQLLHRLRRDWFGNTELVTHDGHWDVMRHYDHE